MTAECGFEMSWVGKCKHPVEHEGVRCNRHSYPCVSCGSRATHDCDSGMMGLMCGAPLCDDCVASYQDGRPGHGHAPKSAGLAACWDVKSLAAELEGKTIDELDERSKLLEYARLHWKIAVLYPGRSFGDIAKAVYVDSDGNQRQNRCADDCPYHAELAEKMVKVELVYASDWQFELCGSVAYEYRYFTVKKTTVKGVVLRVARS